MSSRAVESSAERLLSVEQLRARLREVGEQRYHHRHPFHLLMHEGKLTRANCKPGRSTATTIRVGFP